MPPAGKVTALKGTRGIGPNQVTPAFDFFAEAVKKRRPKTKTLAAEEILKGELPDEWGGDKLVVVVTENYPLPGMDFDQASQPKVIKRLMEKAGKRLIVVALRDPYELRHFPDVPAYVCAFSFRPCAAEAAAQVLFGEAPAKGPQISQIMFSSGAFSKRREADNGLWERISRIMRSNPLDPFQKSVDSNLFDSNMLLTRTRFRRLAQILIGGMRFDAAKWVKKTIRRFRRF